MGFSPDALLNRDFGEVRQEYSTRDSIIYALGIGFGADPLDADDLPFVFEEPQLKAVPTMAVVLAGPGFWAREPDTGIVWQKILHGEQEIIMHRPLPPGGTLAGTTRVTRIIDKGAEKGALIYSERTIRDVGSGDDIATLRATTFARGNGGCGGDTGPQPAPHAIPDRDPDETFDAPTEPRSALLYRLCGDRNPLHVDPEVAGMLGLDRPILHGLCTLGVAGRAILKTCCDNDPDKFASIKMRFSNPVFPGETVRTEMWRDSNKVSFRATIPARDNTVVIDNGLAEIRA